MENMYDSEDDYFQAAVALTHPDLIPMHRTISDSPESR